MANIITVKSLFRITAVIGKDNAAEIDATETYLEIRTTIIQTMRATTSILGIMARSAPAVVATPFPPLKLRNTVHTWPDMAKAAISIL